jgi:SH3 domain-containing protein
LKEDAMTARSPLRFRLLFAVSALFVLGDGPPAMLARATAALAGRAETQPPGSDVFVTPREALLREKPSLQARIVGKLTAGTRLTLTQSGGAFLKVELPVIADKAPANPAGRATGWVSREVVAVFGPGPDATQDLVVVGRVFAQNDANRRLAAALLTRASERLRAANTPDAGVEVLLGETAEAVAAAGGPFPPGLEIQPRAGGAPSRSFYTGAAFQRALELTAREQSPEYAGVRERALAGALRVQYPERSVTLTALWQETAGWLTLVESAQEPEVLRPAAGRLGDAALALGRALLATGKLEEMSKVEERLRLAGARVKTLAPAESDGKKLLARDAILRAMRGNGTPSFPQEARVALGPKQRVVRIDGKLGALTLTVETHVGGTHEIQKRAAAVPVLPVPGSLKVSPDGRSAAWVEVTGPTSLLPVVTSLEKDEPAREIAFLTEGRPLRDRGLAHILSSVSGFSRDGQRLGLAIEAWNETPGPAPRYSVVNVATGELLFETSRDLRGFERLLQ